MTTLGHCWWRLQVPTGPKSRQPYPSSINSAILDVFRINTFGLYIVLTLRMILPAAKKEFSKITGNVTMGRTVECAEVTTLERRTLLLDEFPTVTEANKAIQQLPSGEAPGSDEIRRNLQSRRSTYGKETYRVVSLHVENGGNPKRVQECIRNPLIQTERKSSSLWQP